VYKKRHCDTEGCTKLIVGEITLGQSTQGFCLEHHPYKMGIAKEHKHTEQLRERCAAIARTMATWVTDDSYGAQVDMRERIARAIEVDGDLREGPLMAKLANAVIDTALVVGMLNFDSADSIRPRTVGAGDAFHALEDAVLAFLDKQRPEYKED
jgi:hypothetical protein